MYFVVRGPGNKSTRDITLIKLPKLPGLTISSSGKSNTIFLPYDLDEHCDRLSLLLQEEQARNNSDLINEEIIAIVHKLLEYKCISQKQQKQVSN